MVTTRIPPVLFYHPRADDVYRLCIGTSLYNRLFARCLVQYLLALSYSSSLFLFPSLTPEESGRMGCFIETIEILSFSIDIEITYVVCFKKARSIALILLTSM